MQEKQPLRFRISDWRQLSRAQSNLSTKLSIKVTDFIQNSRLTGLRISVEDEDFGVLFACVLNARGSIVEPLNDNITVEFTPDRIIEELAKFGYLISYVPIMKLSNEMLEYLINLRRFRFEKIRVLNVWEQNDIGVKTFRYYVVAFNSVPNPQWLNNWYSPSNREFVNSIKNGSCMNISAIGRTSGMDFSWLAGYVLSIEDVLEANIPEGRSDYGG